MNLRHGGSSETTQFPLLLPTAPWAAEVAASAATVCTVRLVRTPWENSCWALEKLAPVLLYLEWTWGNGHSAAATRHVKLRIEWILMASCAKRFIPLLFVFCFLALRGRLWSWVGKVSQILLHFKMYLKVPYYTKFHIISCQKQLTYSQTPLPVHYALSFDDELIFSIAWSSCICIAAVFWTNWLPFVLLAF